MLENIKNINDLKNLDIKQLPQLCQEIRQKLIADVSKNGGHLASNLGVVELTVALHYVFGEEDKIVWDVGHQSYVHKILTSRGENFSTLRQKGGISGFPDCEESESDSFNTGHAGTAISAALGLAHARDLSGQNHNVIAVVGDGAMTCGMTYEALNNIKDTKMLIILNDNNMSIGKNVGTATLNMSKLRVGKYDKNKQNLKRFLHKVPLIGKPIYKFLKWCKRRIKLGYSRNSYFDNFNLKYLGVIDGNEVKDLIFYLKKIKENVDKPTVLHIITKKGKGYEVAENNPIDYHAVSANSPVVCLNREEKREQNSQEAQQSSLVTLESATIVGRTLCSLAEQGNNIACITAAMTKAVGLEEFSQKYPQKFFDVGISEEHAVTFAGGLAKGGIHPFVCIYSTFLQRSYDQILHDVALQKLPVTFLVDRAGFVGEDGKTHQGLFDLSYLSNIPNLQIWTPATYLQLQQMIVASLNANSPVAIRYSRYLSEEDISFDRDWQILRSAPKCKVKILCVGAKLCKMALDMDGAEVVCATKVKPLDYGYLASLWKDNVVITLEENVAIGGFGEAVGKYFANSTVKVFSFAVDDKFVPHASITQQIEEHCIDAKSLQEFVKKLL